MIGMNIYQNVPVSIRIMIRNGSEAQAEPFKAGRILNVRKTKPVCTITLFTTSTKGVLINYWCKSGSIHMKIFSCVSQMCAQFICLGLCCYEPKSCNFMRSLQSQLQIRIRKPTVTGKWKSVQCKPLATFDMELIGQYGSRYDISSAKSSELF